MVLNNFLYLGFPRTNNHCEGWHNKVNRMVGSSHPTIFKLIEGLQKEQQNTEHAMSRIEAGQEPQARRPEYIKNEKRILKIAQKFHDDVFDGSYLPYLKSLAHNVSL